MFLFEFYQIPGTFTLPELRGQLIRDCSVRLFKEKLRDPGLFQDMFRDRLSDYEPDLDMIGNKNEQVVVIDKDGTTRTWLQAQVSLDRPNLRVLILHKLPLINHSIGELISLSNLRVLSLEQCQRLTENCHPYIAKLTNLRELRLSSSPELILSMDKGDGVKVNNEIMERLGDLKIGDFSRLINLEVFDFGPFMPVTPQMIKVISELPRLVHLKIQQGQLLDKRSLDQLGTMSKLKELHLYKCQRVEDFSGLFGLLRLEILSLFYSFILDVDLVSFTTLPHLRILDVSRCPKITDIGVDELERVATESQLIWFRAVACKRVTRHREWERFFH